MSNLRDKDTTPFSKSGCTIKFFRKISFPGRGGQKECSKKLGTTSQELSVWESGRTRPGRPMLMKMAKLFDTTINVLVDGLEEGEMDEEQRQRGIDRINTPASIPAGMYGSDNQLSRRTKRRPTTKHMITDPKLAAAIQNMEAIRSLLDRAQRAALEGELSAGALLEVSETVLLNGRPLEATLREIQRKSGGSDRNA